MWPCGCKSRGDTPNAPLSLGIDFLKKKKNNKYDSEYRYDFRVQHIIICIPYTFNAFTTVAIYQAIIYYKILFLGKLIFLERETFLCSSFEVYLSMLYRYLPLYDLLYYIVISIPIMNYIPI